jgi:hypothetical protein
MVSCGADKETPKCICAGAYKHLMLGHLGVLLASVLTHELLASTLADVQAVLLLSREHRHTQNLATVRAFT